MRSALFPGACKKHKSISISKDFQRKRKPMLCQNMRKIVTGCRKKSKTNTVARRFLRKIFHISRALDLMFINLMDKYNVAISAVKSMFYSSSIARYYGITGVQHNSRFENISNQIYGLDKYSSNLFLHFKYFCYITQKVG